MHLTIFFLSLGICFGYHWNDRFSFFQSLYTVPAPPTPCIFQYFSFICREVMVENNDIIVVYLHCSNFQQQGAQLHSVQLIKARWAQNVCGFFFFLKGLLLFVLIFVPHLCWSVHLLPSRMPLVILLCVQKQESIVQHLESHSDAGKEYNSLSKC